MPATTRKPSKTLLLPALLAVLLAACGKTDSYGTNKLEIVDRGWAFGQIADMEAWYGRLKETGKLPAAAHFSVTGYSLGGHLATAFNLLRREDGGIGNEGRDLRDHALAATAKGIAGEHQRRPHADWKANSGNNTAWRRAA